MGDTTMFLTVSDPDTCREHCTSTFSAPFWSFLFLNEKPHARRKGRLSKSDGFLWRSLAKTKPKQPLMHAESWRENWVSLGE